MAASINVFRRSRVTGANPLGPTDRTVAFSRLRPRALLPLPVARRAPPGPITVAQDRKPALRNPLLAGART